MAVAGQQCCHAGATTVGFYNRYAHAVAYSLHGEATDALRRGTASLGVRARRTDHTPRGARALWPRCGPEVRAVLTHTVLMPKL
jgi:hypothetical protein